VDEAFASGADGRDRNALSGSPFLNDSLPVAGVVATEWASVDVESHAGL